MDVDAKTSDDQDLAKMLAGLNGGGSGSAGSSSAAPSIPSLDPSLSVASPLGSPAGLADPTVAASPVDSAAAPGSNPTDPPKKSGKAPSISTHSASPISAGRRADDSAGSATPSLTPPALSMPDLAAAPAPDLTAPSALATSDSAAPGNLESVKKDALSELRPLVDKLDLPPEEKFATLLLIIRSTDDQSLIQPAFAAAKNIPDDAKRAQALLDVIKEIDFFSGK
ncbi:MAG: hypothetical protein LBM73_02970 [Candidatus Nomurabacteria bacterium]|jgi:hypothetical protein|nr:hypothetical protein [Candidatus Nomurabacteria bacterium]